MAKHYPQVLIKLTQLQQDGAEKDLVDKQAAGNYAHLHAVFHESSELTVGNWVLAMTATLVAPALHNVFQADNAYGDYVEAWISMLRKTPDAKSQRIKENFVALGRHIWAISSVMAQSPRLSSQFAWKRGPTSALNMLSELAQRAEIIKEYQAAGLFTPRPGVVEIDLAETCLAPGAAADVDIEWVEASASPAAEQAPDNAATEAKGAGSQPQPLASTLPADAALTGHAAPESDRHVAQKVQSAEDQLQSGSTRTGPPWPAMSEQRHKNISHALTDILRHTAGKKGLAISDSGLVRMTDLLAVPKLWHMWVTQAEVEQVVWDSRKQRFELVTTDGGLYIRATQGHSISVNNALFQTRLTADTVPKEVYHGTSWDFYQGIYRDGLIAGGPGGHRRDIHFVAHLPGQKEVISGLRATSDIIVVVDSQAAAVAGHTFFRSTNEVILSAGVEGIIPPRFISAVIVRATGERIRAADPDRAPEPGDIMAGLIRAHRVYMARALHQRLSVAVHVFQLSIAFAPQLSTSLSMCVRPGLYHAIWVDLSSILRCCQVNWDGPWLGPRPDRRPGMLLAVLMLLLPLGLAWVSALNPYRHIAYYWCTCKILKGVYVRRRVYLARTEHSHNQRHQHWNVLGRIHGQRASSHGPSTMPTSHHNLEYPQQHQHVTCSRPSPKSRANQRQRAIPHGAKALFLMSLIGEVRVATGASLVAGGRPHSGPAEGAGLAHTSMLPHGTSYSWSAKRAFRRARARAVQNGHTIYRGQRHTPQTLQMLRDIPPNRPPRRAYRRQASHNDRLRVLTFNIGGASSAAWQELMTWLHVHDSQFDVVLCQETHWKQSTETFMSGPWAVITSSAGESDKCGGLATLVHKRICHPDNISYETKMKGRLLHVRLHGPQNCVDVLNLYQHVWRLGMSDQSTQKRRAGVWQALRRSLNTLPVRNTMVLGGDFNISLPTVASHVGTSIIPKVEPLPDLPDIQAIMQDYGLVAVNTWHAKSKATCLTGDTQSQIDYLVCRAQAADGIAKQAMPLCTELGVWKSNRHIPVQASIPYTRPWHLRKRPGPAKSLDLHGLQRDIEQGAEQAEMLLSVAATTYPASRSPDNRVSMQVNFRQRTTDMWTSYRAYRQRRVDSLAGVIQAWRAWTTFKHHSKFLKREAAIAKRGLALDRLQQLEAAANRGDQREVYALARRLAPWKPRQRVCIRDRNGALLSPLEQVQALKDHSLEKFCKDAPLNLTHTLQESFQVTSGMVSSHLRKLPLRKAGPPGAAPSALWRLSHEVLAPLIARHMATEWRMGSSGAVPPALKDAYLVWIAKVGKDASQPSGLRPIGLTHPVGKILCTVLRLHIRPALQQALRLKPQFAYTAGRSTHDALLRAHGHIAQVAELIKRTRKSIYALHEGAQQSKCSGGLMFSLDLIAAFDTVPRRKLAEALLHVGVSEDCVHLLMQFHEGSNYSFKVGDHAARVETTCGIKQGCRVAPYLFIALTIHVMDSLETKLGGEWLRDHFTFYADDALATWLISTSRDLRLALHGIQTIIDVFNNFGLSIGPQKSAILIDVQGTEAKKEIRKWRVGDKDARSFPYEQHRDTVQIPIRKQHPYLGTILAYRQSPTLTCNHRLLKARGQYSMLRKIVNAGRLVCRLHRHRIWQAGVQSSLVYGLAATGLTASSAGKVNSFVNRQVRAIAGLPAHKTHITNAEIRAMLGCEDVLTVIRTSALARKSELVAIQAEDSLDIRAHPQALAQLDRVISTLQDDGQQHGLRPLPDADAPTFACDVCGVYFPTLKTMRQHRARTHQQKVQYDTTFDPALHSVNGLPQCRYCKHNFVAWPALRKHIEGDSCTARHTVATNSEREPFSGPVAETSVQLNSEPPPPVIRDPEILRLLSAGEWEKIAESGQAHKLKQHCCYCTQWIKDPTALKRHFIKAHRDVWQSVEQRLEDACSTFKDRFIRDAPCPFCARTAYSRHFKQCNVVFQSALIHLYHQGQCTQLQDDGPHAAAAPLRSPAPGTEPGARHSEGGTRLTEDSKQEASAPGRIRKGSSREAPRGRQRGGASEPDGQNSPSTRGRAQPSPARQVVHSIPHPGPSCGDPGATLPSQPAVAHGKRSQASGGAWLATGGSLQSHDAGTPAAHAQPEEQRGSSQDCARPGNTERGNAPIRKVGQNEKGSGDRPSSEPCRVGRGPGDLGGDPQVGIIHNPPQVPRHQETQGRTRGGSTSSIPTGSRLERKGGRPTAQPASKSTRQRSLASCWGTVPGSQPAAPWTISPAPEEAASQVGMPRQARLILDLVLPNEGETCYANASVFALLWQAAWAPTWEHLPQSWVHAITEGRASTLSLLRFQLLGWPQPRSQHDVAEFLGFIVPRIRWPPTQVQWERRTMQDGGIICDCQRQGAVFSLDPPDGMCTSEVQQAITDWHSQADGLMTHALISTPDWLLIQLPRFRVGAQGMVKHRIPIRLEGLSLRLPVFRDAETLEMEWHRYDLSAAIIHIGGNVAAGHYRTLLLAGEAAWFTEDGVKATRVDSGCEVAAENCYVLACRLVGRNALV